eukprot:CAMPEP_0172719884 /NCGR_PEP_ID=MMETSP1074-20121228/75762_1 /TAXON_ID=2916 /ORGANISM="Ceratium fusus, Strain PA161109" /LENGTH=189 /DNA_ID=CAMNT_0013545283 /DNA_START=471 /DNA_END=1040 /DNA_ORIENTATION=+
MKCTNSTLAQALAWPHRKKQWCCKHQNVGCPSTAIATTTSASTMSGCEVQCMIKDSSASCMSRVSFAARFLFADGDKPCDAAYAWVLAQCPSCSDCQTLFSGCKNVQPTTTSADVATAKHACDTKCVGNGGSISCRERVKSTANTFAGDPDACVLAFASVLKSCQVCAACPLADVGCNVVTHVERPSPQ